MLLPIKWLKDYVNIENIDIRELSDGLTASGSHVEAISVLESKAENIVVGKIESIERHPEADRLVITKVNIGDEILTIVTGAKNIKEGDYVPLALVGSKLADGTDIGLTNFRGIDSHGMMCSLDELGYSSSLVQKEYRDGVYIFEKAEELGRDVKEVFEIFGEVMELEITPNRPDCLSIIGMARETAATFDKKLNLPKISIENEVDDIFNYIEGVEADKELVSRYYGKVIKNIEVKDSPQWIQNRLMEAGVRPVNNIVDITNYVMLETGQPLHAFDLDKINGKINVRRAKDKEAIKTLDGVERILSNEDLIISDEDKALAIAGIMGSEIAEVTKDTKNIFIESANFNSKNIRLTSKRLNLRTDASSRFEKWIDLDLSKKACLRACQLIESIGLGEVVAGNIDEFNSNIKINEITLRPNRVEKLLGEKIEEANIIDYLTRLGFEVEKGNTILVKVPSFRLDIQREVDLIEEIGRLYGFHNIKKEALSGEIIKGERPYSRNIEREIRDVLLGYGLDQVMSYSFISPKAYDSLNLAEDDKRRKSIELINPLGKDYSIMRRTILSNILTLLSNNYKHKIEECMYFEIGNIFEPLEIPVVNQPIQKRMLTIGMYGDTSFYHIKAILNTVFKRLNIENIEYVIEQNNPSFHPNRTAKILLNGLEIGVVGEIHMDVQANYSIKERVYAAEIDMDTIIENAVLENKLIQLPKYPSVSRDIAVVVSKDVLFGDIEKLIWENNTGIIESIDLFDVYSGDQIDLNKKSIAFSINYRSKDKTLEDKDVKELQDKILVKLKEKFEAELRS